MRTELIDDVRTTVTTRTPDEIKTETTRVVRLRVVDGPVIETGSERRPWRYAVDLVRIEFVAGKMTGFATYGVAIKVDGTPGKRTEYDAFDPDGTRWIYRDREPAPAEIMDEVAKWL